jgi:hypothetical protein
MHPGRDESAMRRMGTAALAGVLVFMVVCTAVQFLRTDLDWARTPLSFYLVDGYGGWVRAAYGLLSVALGLIGIGYYRALTPQARSGVAAALFVLAGLALAVTALAETQRPRQALTLEGMVHAVAAPLAFLFVTSAMLLQSWCLRGDAQWRARFAPAFILAVASFAALWGHALWRTAPRGLTQKVVIVVILVWLALAATWLRRIGAAAPDRLAMPEEAPAGDG